MTVAVELGERFRSAMRGTASGVAVIATDGPAGRRGVTISTFASLSVEPPSVVACIHKDSQALSAILANSIFAANVLAVKQVGVAKAFAGQMPELRENRFASGQWRKLSTGAPVLEDAVASFDCKVSEAITINTHSILIGQVVELAAGKSAPLVFSDCTFQSVSNDLGG